MFIVLLGFLACDDHKFSGGHSSETITESGYAGVEAIFSSSCASCHGGSFPPLDGDICTDVVDVSSQQADMLLITAGAAEESYLFHKVSNTHLDQGGSGSQMPMGGALEQSELDILSDWINDGAVCE